MNFIRKNFKRILKQKGLKQSKIAENIGLSAPQISRVAKFNDGTELGSILKLSKGLGIKPWELFVDYDAGEIGPILGEDKEAVLDYLSIKEPKEKKLILDMLLAHSKRR